ncbi:hypothetical protein O181_009103 [Austropuccinia psidii MF-1]|uniref:Integrase catalytic domain-containing protein n=1 Tax=Austropuccinia psidii MF-1 TaxID=1389203 RepID=A0A9Q3GJ51_9BASI|nr:hypothetical protein [Austropuccinia psidii MF-1]
MAVVRGEESDRSAVVSSSSCLFEMNPISLPASVLLSPHGWHNHLGHACNNIVYPLKACYEAPEAILDAIKQLQVQLGATPKVLQTDNVWEFTSTSFTNAIAKLGITFCPSLPYSPQENGEAECLNWMLGDMARAMMIQSHMPECFWQFAYSSAAFIHNRLPNLQCLN